MQANPIQMNAIHDRTESRHYPQVHSETILLDS